MIYEQPQAPDTAVPSTGIPDTENPYLDEPDMDTPCTEKPAQLNTNRSNTDESNTHKENPNLIKSYPIHSPDEVRTDRMEEYREIVKENIEYDILKDDSAYARDRLDEIVELMAETLCGKKATICIAVDEYPASAVKAKLLRLNSLHIQYVFECLDKNASEVRNIKKYLLATLFNAPSTMGNYYKAQVNHDLYAS